MSQQLNLFGDGDDSFFGGREALEVEPLLSTDERALDIRDALGRNTVNGGLFEVELEGTPLSADDFGVDPGPRFPQEEGPTSPPSIGLDQHFEQLEQQAAASGALSPTDQTRTRQRDNIEAGAIEAASRGHQEAVDALVFEAGWDRAEAEALGQQVKDPTSSMTEPEFQRIVDAEIKRSRSSGRFATAPTGEGPPGVNRRRTSGRFISSPLADTEIGRDTQTGRFTPGDRR